jgi:AAA domain
LRIGLVAQAVMTLANVVMVARQAVPPQGAATMTVTAFPRNSHTDDDEPSFWSSAFSNWQELDPTELEPRWWIYGKHYLEGSVSATIADGGVGKSTLALTEAIAIATGKPLLGITPNNGRCDGEIIPFEVLYYNAEEPLCELKRRVLAICQHHNIDPKVLGIHNGWDQRLTLVSGHDYPLVLAKSDGDGFAFTDDVEWLENSDFDVIILDPFVSLHQCPENDNSMIDAIVKRLGRIAATPRVKAIELVHHARKPAQGGNVEINAADARGASALGDGVRSLRMLNRMTSNEATRAKVDNPRNYFRVDNGKSNYAEPSDGSIWYRHQSIILPNGDDVGIVVSWHFPGAFDGVTAAHMHQVRGLAGSGKYRADHRSPDWIGHAVADVLDLDADDDGERKRIRTVLKEWFSKGVLKKVERKGADRHSFVFVEPGEWTEP